MTIDNPGDPAAQIGFSVIIPTRNRPKLVRAAIDSVMAQTCRNFELIIVDDGSDEAARAALAALASDPRITVLHLPWRPDGHGPSFAINRGAAAAQQPYICFLDDDDFWVDPSHLARAAEIISAEIDMPDLVYSQQMAVRTDGTRIASAVWIEDLLPYLQRHAQPGPHGAYRVTRGALMQSRNFCHLNTSIVRREFFLTLGGLDEGLRYEQDRDFYLRSLDSSDKIFYCPAIVSRHNVPDPTQRSNASTQISQLQKLVSTLSLYQKSGALASHLDVRLFCRAQAGDICRRIAVARAAEAQFKDARDHALTGLALRPSLKWAAMCAYYTLRAAWR